MAYGSLVHRVAARARKKGPAGPHTPEPPPNLEARVHSAVRSLLSETAYDSAREALQSGHLDFKIGSKTSQFSDGTHPPAHSHSALGYAFTVTYPTEATAKVTGSIKVPDLDRHCVEQFIDTEPEQVKEALKGFDVEKYLEELVQEGLPKKPGETGFGFFEARIEEDIESAAGEKVETSVEAYSDEEPGGVDLSEYPDIYLAWDIQLKSGKVARSKLSGDTFKFELVIDLQLKPKYWTFDQELRTKHWLHLSFH